MSPKEFLELPGNFTWLGASEFFIETHIGNFLWSDRTCPGGSNTMTYTSKTYDESLYGSRKGVHIIGNYAGREVIFTKGTIGFLSRF